MGQHASCSQGGDNSRGKDSPEQQAPVRTGWRCFRGSVQGGKEFVNILAANIPHKSRGEPCAGRPEKNGAGH